MSVTPADHRLFALMQTDDGNANLAEAIKAYRFPLSDLRGCTDEIEAAHHAARLILAAEDVAKAAEGIATSGREILATWMQTVGAPSVRTDTHTVSLVERKPAPRVVDPLLVPEAFRTTPKPRPDMETIKRAYAKGENVPGTTLDNGAPPHVQFRPRSK